MSVILMIVVLVLFVGCLTYSFESVQVYTRSAPQPPPGSPRPKPPGNPQSSMPRRMKMINRLMLDFRYPALAGFHRPVKINVFWRTPWKTKFYVPLTYLLWLLLGTLQRVRERKYYTLKYFRSSARRVKT